MPLWPACGSAFAASTERRLRTPTSRATSSAPQPLDQPQADRQARVPAQQPLPQPPRVQGIEEDFVLTAPFEVLQAGAVGAGVRGAGQDVVGFASDSRSNSGSALNSRIPLSLIFAIGAVCKVSSFNVSIVATSFSPLSVIRLRLCRYSRRSGNCFTVWRQAALTCVSSSRKTSSSD